MGSRVEPTYDQSNDENLKLEKFTAKVSKQFIKSTRSHKKAQRHLERDIDQIMFQINILRLWENQLNKCRTKLIEYINEIAEGQYFTVLSMEHSPLCAANRTALPVFHAFPEHFLFSDQRISERPTKRISNPWHSSVLEHQRTLLAVRSVHVRDHFVIYTRRACMWSFLFTCSNPSLVVAKTDLTINNGFTKLLGWAWLHIDSDIRSDML